MSKLDQWWADFRDSLWFLPTVLAAAAILLAVGLLVLDRAILTAGRADQIPWIFGGGAEGARGVLSAIAGGIITVTGVIFSVTIVALQLASTQFTPRVLRTFTSDPGNQLTLGVLIGTFTYTLVVLRTVRARADGTPFVPAVSVTVAVALALVSIGFLIFFIGHVARSLQVTVIVDRIANETIERVRKDYVAADSALARRRPPDAPRDPQRVVSVPARDAGYLQSVDDRPLLEFAERRGLTIRVEADTGAFVLPGMTLLSAWPARRVRSGDGDRMRKTVVLGRERTAYADPAWGLREIADIAVRALSASLNDPTTAALCVDRLAEVLIEIGRRAPVRVVGAPGGRAVLIRRWLSFERAVGVAFDAIRRDGAGEPAVAKRILDAIGAIAPCVPPERRVALAREATLVLRGAERSIRPMEDLSRVRRAGALALERTGPLPTAGSGTRPAS